MCALEHFTCAPQFAHVTSERQGDQTGRWYMVYVRKKHFKMTVAPSYVARIRQIRREKLTWV